MKNNLKKAIIILFLGIIIYLTTMGVFGYYFHQSLWGRDTLQDLLALLFIAPILLPYALGLLIVGSVELYKKLKVKKLTLSLIMLAIYISPIAMLSVYRFIDHQIYDSTYAFSAEKWATANEDERSHMIHYFREQHELVEKELEYAIILLGQPDREEDLKYYYSLGLEEAVLVTHEVYYLIEFDFQNIITNESIIEVPHHPNE